MRFLFSKQSPRFNYSLSKCLLKTLIFFFLLFSCMAHIESVCCCCLVSGAFIKRTDVENCKHRLYPNNIFSLRFSSWSFFLLNNNNIGGCIQHISGLFPKSPGAGGGRVFAHGGSTPLSAREKSVQATELHSVARRSRKTHTVGKGRRQVSGRPGIEDLQRQEGPRQARPLLSLTGVQTAGPGP